MMNLFFRLFLGASIVALCTLTIACGDENSDFATRPDGKESSSSSILKSNSSVTNVSSGSSVTLATPCKTDSTDTCEYGTLTDSRDGQTYKTVKIGDQIWMAENLNYAYIGIPFKYKESTSDSTSWCYGDDPAYCSKYGRLYTWAAAMDSAGMWSTNGKGCGYETTCSPIYPVRGVCPVGWHLPTRTEWNTLLIAVGGFSTAGHMLKSTSGWDWNWKWNNYEGQSGNGTDAFGFSVLPVHGRDHDGKYYDEGCVEGCFANFWSSSRDYGQLTYYLYLVYYELTATLAANDLVYGFSVRCVRD
jgi:uncharacterized protein (TIGR02145 family)